MPALIAHALAVNFSRWLHHLGGPGLVVLGVANSLIPLPGSADVLTIWLTAHHRVLCYYYATMATLGAVLGGSLTYQVAYKGGKETLERRMGRRRAHRVYRRFERWGFGAVAVPALLPPPFPIIPFLLAAGAMQYSRRKFLAALTLGRGLRYSILAYLGLRYGDSLIAFFDRYTAPTVYALLAMALLAGAAALIGYLHHRKHSSESVVHGPAPAPHG